jgi:hypothetical protein
MPSESLDWAKQCKVIARVEDGAAVLCCYLHEDHTGPHWDKHDRLFWSVDVFGGGPGKEAPNGE